MSYSTISIIDLVETECAFITIPVLLHFMIFQVSNFFPQEYLWYASWHVLCFDHRFIYTVSSGTHVHIKNRLAPQKLQAIPPDNVPRVFLVHQRLWPYLKVSPTKVKHY